MTKPLSKHLLIQSPSEITQTNVWSQLDADYMSAAPPFRFRRSREIGSTAQSWMEDLFNGEAAEHWQEKNAVQGARHLLEALWIDDLDVGRDAIAMAAFNHIKNYPSAEGLPADHADYLPPLFCPTLDNGTVPVPAGSVVALARTEGAQGPHSVIYYLLESIGGEPITAASFPDNGDPEDYDDVWKKRITSVKRVYPEGAPALTSSHEFLDLSIGAILQRYPFLRAQRDLNEALRLKLVERLKTEEKYPTVKALFVEVQSLNQEQSRLKRSTSSLIGFAATKGYTLLDRPDTLTPTIRGVKQPSKEYFPGDMFRTKRFVTRWVEEHLIHRSRRRFLRSTKRWTEVKRVNRSAQDVDYEKIDSTDSVLSDFIQFNLNDRGFTNAVILQSVPGGYQAEDGRSLSSVLDRCELDASYQASCALLMPVYRQSLFGEDVIAGYHVIRNPKRGRRIVAMPEFFFEEQISYKLRWLGMELGELLSSINLLPGEVRDISIKTTRNSLHEDEIKSTQSFEAESSNSFDTVSSVENEFQRENTSEKTRSWSVKASGSYGGFSAGGSKSGTSKQTARQFAKSLNKLTTQAISKMRKSSRSEVVARELNREELESVSSSSGQVSNPNVGRTLNVNYFAVNNVFASSTYLDDIGFSYISPFELIDGTDIREVRTFAKEDLPEFLESVRRDIARMIEAGLDFAPDLVEAGDRPTRREVADRGEALAVEFVAKLKSDFLAAFQDYSSDRDPLEKVVENEPVEAFMVKETAAEPRAVDLEQDQDLEEMIDRLVATGRPIEPDVVISPSPAVYADASTGATEGLESYAVDMRKLEVEKQFAEVVAAMTTQKDASKASVRTHHNVSHEKTDDDELTVTIGGDIQPGEWSYRVGGSVIGTLSVVEGRASYVVPLPANAPGEALLEQLPGSMVRYV